MTQEIGKLYARKMSLIKMKLWEAERDQNADVQCKLMKEYLQIQRDMNQELSRDSFENVFNLNDMRGEKNV